MRLFMIVLLFISFAVNCHAETISDVSEKQMNLDEALKMYSTPFIDNYRKRYWNDPYTRGMSTGSAYRTCSGFYKSVTFKIPCSKQDIENIKQLAKYGDEASLELAFSFIDDNNLYMQYAKQAADNGSVEGAISYGDMIMRKNPILGISYLEKAKISGDLSGYMALLRFYSANNRVQEFCRVAFEGYEKFGFDFLALILLSKTPTYQEQKQLSILFEQYPELCLQSTSTEVLKSFRTYASQLYQGYIDMNNKQYSNAAKIFQELYSKSDDINIKHNAGFCLGAMYYSGSAVKKNIKYGIKLMEEAVTNGYEMLHYIPEIKVIPNDTKILKYKALCEVFLFEEMYQRSIK